MPASLTDSIGPPAFPVPGYKIMQRARYQRIERIEYPAHEIYAHRADKYMHDKLRHTSLSRLLNPAVAEEIYMDKIRRIRCRGQAVDHTAVFYPQVNEQHKIEHCFRNHQRIMITVRRRRNRSNSMPELRLTLEIL